MQKPLSWEKLYPTHISTATELRRCADSTFQSFLNTQHVGSCSSQYQRGWERLWKTNQAALLPAAARVRDVRLPPPRSAGRQRASAHPREARRNPLAQTGNPGTESFQVTDFVPNDAVREQRRWEHVPGEWLL